MVNNQKRVEIVDPETGESHGINVAMIVNDARDIMLSWRRNQLMSTSWGSLSEADQQDFINQCEAMAYAMTKGIVDLVATRGFDVVRAKLQTFTVKDGKVKLTAEGHADDNVLLTLNHAGHKNITVFVSDISDFDQQRETIRPDPDQPSLEMDDEPEEPEAFDDSDTMLDDSAPPAEEPEADRDEPDEDLRQEEVGPGEQGYNAGIGQQDKDCPYPDGSPAAAEWLDGYEHGTKEAQTVIEEGQAAASLGMEKNPYKDGSEAARLWDIGYQRESDADNHDGTKTPEDDWK